MEDRAHQLITRHLAGESVRDIARDLGISRARAYQLIQQARESGEYSVHVQVLDARGVPLEHVGAFLRRQLASAGLATHKRRE